MNLFPLLAMALAVGVSACTPVPQVATINDPYEKANRGTHKFNKAVDKRVLKPISGVVGGAGSGPLGSGINNFASNLAMPGVIVNDILQLNIDDAFSNTFRFALNSTFGLGGVLDVATNNGLAEQKTDFGETLHVWGFQEGRFVELPFFGPSTERDAAGMVVDYFMDPLKLLLPAPQKYVGTAASLMNKVGKRSKYAALFNQILYESDDSYAQSRLLYLQSRRRELYGELSDDILEDPYAE